MKRVAVTGLGVISPVGNDVPTFWNALCSGTCGIGPITKFDATDYPVKLAAEAGVAVGAHPGYPDLQGFGRRDMALSPDEAYSFVLYQISALAGFCKAEGTALAHVKPHGQLYNRAAKDAALAEAIAAAVHDFDPTLVLVGLAGGKLIKKGTPLDVLNSDEFARAFHMGGDAE